MKILVAWYSVYTIAHMEWHHNCAVRNWRAKTLMTRLLHCRGIIYGTNLTEFYRYSIIAMVCTEYHAPEIFILGTKVNFETLKTKIL